MLRKFGWLAIGLLLGLVAVAAFGLLLWLTRSPQAQEATKEELGLVEATATSYVITAVIIGPATAQPVPTVTATPTPIVTPTPAAFTVLQPRPEPPPTVTPLPPRLEGLGGLIQGLFGSWLYEAVEGK